MVAAKEPAVTAMTADTTPTMAPVESPLDPFGARISKADWLPSSSITAQNPCQLSSHLLSDGNKALSFGPMLTTAGSWARLGPGACARNQSPW